MIVRELTETETILAYRPMVELRAGRPYLATSELFTSWINEQQRPEGYRLVASFAANRDGVVAVAGFRRLHALSRGAYLYVDDLVTRAGFRGHGHAAALFDWLMAEAQRLGCEQLHLDSGMQRHTAHRFYLNHKLDIMAYHFQCSLGDA